MAPPTKPTAPPQPLRSQPSTFSARAEAAINYQWTNLPNWMETLAVFVEDQKDAAEAAAAAAGSAGGFDLTGKGGYFFRVNSGATGTEFVSPTGLVSREMVEDSAINFAKIANGAVTEAKLGSDAVVFSKIADGAVIETKLGSGSVVFSKIADGAVINTKLGSNSVSAVKIQDGAVTRDKIQDAAINFAKIADGAVIDAKLGSTAIPDKLGFLPAPVPKNSSGLGQWFRINFGIGGSTTLPSGGTWAYFVVFVTGADTVSSNGVGVAAGGSSISSGANSAYGFAWRIQ